MRNDFLLIIPLVLADQLSKLAAERLFASPIAVTQFFSLQLSLNSGAAFGIFQKSYLALLFLGIFMLGLLLWLHEDFQKNAATRIAFILLFAGIAGNCIDRLLLHGVRDFLSLSFWPSSNLADIFMSAGAALTILSVMRKNK